MGHCRLFLAGDAAHVVSPTGAKGLNVTFSDVQYLSGALIEHDKNGSWALGAYSETAFRRMWRAVRFAWWMTTMLHWFLADARGSSPTYASCAPTPTRMSSPRHPSIPVSAGTASGARVHGRCDSAAGRMRRRGHRPNGSMCSATCTVKPNSLTEVAHDPPGLHR